jgi:hypothetical protein
LLLSLLAFSCHPSAKREDLLSFFAFAPAVRVCN